MVIDSLNQKIFRVLFFAILVLFVRPARAQCPLNIDFEQGNFNGWESFTGSVRYSGNTNIVSVTTSPPTSNIHTLIPKGTLRDPYGGFPISPPNGSLFSVKLGNNGSSSRAERLTYTFTVPADEPNFSMTYQYAVVLQDPGHALWQQPRFSAKVFDIAANAYITCSSFDYVATANLPGFKIAPGYTGNNTVIYKDWTPVSINLTGYAGKRIRLEFTTADCTESAHFGYAYIDVNSNCTDVITGNEFCSSATSTNIKGPDGFDKYTWYNADRSKVLGNTNPLVLTTLPNNGDKILLDVVPFAGFGCPNTLSTVVKRFDLALTVTDPPPVCAPGTVDITQGAGIIPADNKAVYTYWKDAACTDPVADAKKVPVSGVYYVKVVNSGGCQDVKPVNVVVSPPPTIVITQPAPVCIGALVDITLPAITAGSTPGITLSYWADANATTPLADPKKIAQPGTVYVKAITVAGCTSVAPINVTFYPPFTFKITDPPAVCFPAGANLTASSVTAGSTPGLTYTYFSDAAATAPIAAPADVKTSGTYYVKATSAGGCIEILPVKAVVNPLPELQITAPAGVCYPNTIDITVSSVTAGSTNVDKLSYWADAAGQVPLIRPTAVSVDGTYYIKATATTGCEIIKPVRVTIFALPILKITAPTGVYAPLTIDITKPDVTKGSSDSLVYTYFEDAAGSKPLAKPSAVEKDGTYYIMATNKNGCSVISPVRAVITQNGQILVPKAFTPTKLENNKLFAFTLGIQTFVSFKVYNRWGVMLYQTDNTQPERGWDGYYRGQLQQMDTYTWYAEGRDYLGKTVRNSGNTLLIK